MDHDAQIGLPGEPENPYLIRTWTGRLVDPWNLTADDIDIKDIAHALARIARFNGHTTGVISVAEHCVWVSRHLSGTPYRLEGLLHDASEAYLCDIPSPLKRQPGMEEYRHAEARAETAIADRFDLVFRAPEVKAADTAAYVHDVSIRWDDRPVQHPDYWERVFLNTFIQLRAARKKAA